MDLTEISGIGSSVADDLADAGFETAEDVAEADVDDLAEVHGFGDARAENVKEAALDLFDESLEVEVEEIEEEIEEEDEGEEETEAAESDVTPSEDEDDDLSTDDTADADDGDTDVETEATVDEEETVETYDVTMTVTGRQYDHFYGALGAHVISLERGNLNAEALRDVMIQLRAVSVPAEGETEFTLEMTEEQLNYTHQALNEWFNEHREPPYIKEVKALLDGVQEARAKHLF